MLYAGCSRMAGRGAEHQQLALGHMTATVQPSGTAWATCSCTTYQPIDCYRALKAWATRGCWLPDSQAGPEGCSSYIMAFGIRHASAWKFVPGLGWCKAMLVIAPGPSADVQAEARPSSNAVSCRIASPVNAVAGDIAGPVNRPVTASTPMPAASTKKGSTGVHL